MKFVQVAVCVNDVPPEHVTRSALPPVVRTIAVFVPGKNVAL